MRMRFKKDERAAFVIGAEIDWLHGSHWRPGVVTGPVVRDDGWDSVQIKDCGPTTRTISTGERVDPEPGHVRLRQAPAGNEGERR